MNYSPKSYKNLCEIQKSLESAISNLENISFDTDIEDAQSDLNKINKEVNSEINNLNNDNNTLISEVNDLMYTDLIAMQENYTTLVNANYEKEVFPFDDWLYDIDIPKWKAEKHWLTKMEDFAHTPEGNVLFIENIICFYDAAVKYNPQNIIQIFEWSLEAMNSKYQHFNVDEIKEEVKQRFIFDNYTSQYIYNLTQSEQEKNATTNNPQINEKIKYYLNYLFKDPIKNEDSIREVMSFIKNNKDNEKTKILLSTLCSDVMSLKYHNSFLVINSYENKIRKINYEKYLKLFEYDIEYGLELSPYIVQNLKKVQDSYLNGDSDKEKLISTILEIEKGYAAHKLSLKLTNDNVRKEIKIKL